MERTFFQKVQIRFIELIAKVRWNSWSSSSGISEADREILREMFARDYYIVSTRRSSYLSSWFMNLGNFFLTGRWGYWTHVLMNLEDEVQTDTDFRFIEATGHGTHYSTLEEVLDKVSAIGLFKPVSMTTTEWTACLDQAKTMLGRPYDNLFNLVNGEEVNCVELVRSALMALPDYSTRFAAFEKMIASAKGKLTPTMLVNCSDFHVVWVVKG